jgi:peptide/nickel transport system permease protein
MAGYLLRRLLQALPVLIGVAVIAFLVTRLTPGGPAQAVLGEKATAEKIAQLNRDNGWDRPLPVQFVRFCASTLTGDLGRSYHTGRPVAQDLRRCVPATIELALAAMLIATCVGVPLGIVAALRPGRALDLCTMGGALAGVSVPVFFLGLCLLMLFPDLPGGGRLPVTMDLEPLTGLYLVDTLWRGDGAGFAAALRHLLLPAVALASVPLGMIARMTRSSVLEVLHEDFVRTARAKGLAPPAVVLRHALRNALVPIVTTIGLNVGLLLAGAVLTETVFQWPGLGRYLVESVLAKDYNAVQAGLLVTATTFVLVNLCVDLSYAWIDPRVRLGAAGTR